MSVVLEMLVPAVALSGAAVVCLLALPNAPAALRLCLALGGLAAWFVPWPLIDLPLVLPDIGVLSVERPVATLVTSAVGAPGVRSLDVLWYVLLALLVPGIAWFLADWVTLHRALERWTRRSRPGDALRALLPQPLQSTRMRIRVVAGTRVAAAVGWIRPTIWVGDGFTDVADLRLALVHECWHVRRRDPLWLAALTAARRVYWWNPVVAHLVGELEILIEAACDRRCIGSLGRKPYISRLAAMMLGADARVPARLAAAVYGRNVQRLKLLQAQARLRFRDCLLVAALAACGGLAAGYAVAEPRGPDARLRDRVVLPGTPARDALAAVLRGVGAGDLELVQTYFGAYTPQEVKFERRDWSDGLELVEVVNDDGLGIEFVVRDANGKRRLGRLRVADSAAIQVTASEFHDLPGQSP
jgi:BlaR1 peptidase M56